MTRAESLSSTHLRTPRAAAIAGIVFSALLMTVLVLIWSSVPMDPLDPGAWLSASSRRVAFALNLMPFAGVAFLWFIGVLRDRLGSREDRLFATVFLGSGLLFLGMMFVAAAIIGAIIIVHAARPEALLNSSTFAVARAFTYNLVNIYAIKMAGVFMMVTSMLAIRTEFAARWIGMLGVALALFLLFGSQFFYWSFLTFPAWVLLISVYILVDNFRYAPEHRQDDRVDAGS